MNFAVIPRYVPVKEIVTMVEQSISNLPRDSKDEVKSDVCNILKKAKPPRVSNVNTKKRQAIGNLKRNKGILVLPADKGNTN